MGAVTSFLRRLWSWLGPDLRQLRNTEPAVLTAHYAQLAGVLAAAGLTIPHIIDYRIGIALAAWGVVAPWVQGRKTRADVFSPQTAQDLADLVRMFPGLSRAAEAYLAAGWSKWEAYLELDKAAQAGKNDAALDSEALVAADAAKADDSPGSSMAA